MMMGEIQQWDQLNPGEEKGHILEGSETCPTPNCLPEKAKLFQTSNLAPFVLYLLVCLLGPLSNVYVFIFCFVFVSLFVPRSKQNPSSLTSDRTSAPCSGRHGVPTIGPSRKFHMCVQVKVWVTQSHPILCHPWTVAHQAPLSMEFSRQDYWSGLPFLSPGNLPNQVIEPALQADYLMSESCIFKQTHQRWKIHISRQ